MSHGIQRIKEVLGVASVKMNYGEDGAQIFTVGKGAETKTMAVAPRLHIEEIIRELQKQLAEK
jgi:hypothetical protein